jgi:hypothetical protein
VIQAVSIVAQTPPLLRNLHTQPHPSLRKCLDPENIEKRLYFVIVAQESHSCATFFEKNFTTDDTDAYGLEKRKLATLLFKFLCAHLATCGYKSFI